MKSTLLEHLKDIPKARVAVIGDVCLDVYWEVDESSSLPSIETGLKTLPVQQQRSALGSAGTIINNLLAMGVLQVELFSVIAEDPFGLMIQKHCQSLGISREGLIIQNESWQTPAYIKPLHEGQEGRRFDLGINNVICQQSADDLFKRLSQALEHIDVVLINQQFEHGIHSDHSIELLNQLIQQHPSIPFLCDARHHAHRFTGSIRKLNEYEACESAQFNLKEGETPSLSICRKAAEYLCTSWEKPVLISRGDRGLLMQEADQSHFIHPYQVDQAIDIVGAGDSLLAGIGACLASGSNLEEACRFGNTIAAITIQKLNQTGTARPEEIQTFLESAHLRYHPDLAEASAIPSPHASIEIIEHPSTQWNITHMIFDHDGTLSLLRMGWEDIMEEMMLKAICGDTLARQKESTLTSIRQTCRNMIHASTGQKTISQMEQLIELIQDYQFIKAEDLLDAQAYKDCYNDQLLAKRQTKLEQLNRDPSYAEKLMPPGAMQYLNKLKQAGVHLTLVSGSDQDDVIDEAKRLAYHDLFQGGIHGAKAGAQGEIKALKTAELCQLAKGSQHLASIGDGPMEIREIRKREGLGIGLAYDEIRGQGIDSSRRKRLIEAGAQMIISDYQDIHQLPIVYGRA